jgi:hypothetical protein
MGPRRWRWGACGVAIAALSVAQSAAAQEQVLEAGAIRESALTLTYRAIYHAYQIRLYPSSDPTVYPFTNPTEIYRNVNPLYMTLEVGGWALAGGNVDAVVSLRYNTDFGTGFHRDTPVTAGIPAVDGRNDFDIIFMYVDWRNVIDKTLDLRIGRQMVLDDLAWYRLDGLKSTVHVTRSSTATVDVEAYVGMPVRYDVLFSSSAMIADGYEVIDGSPGLAFGGAVFARLFSDLSLSAAYRQELMFRGNSIDVFRGPPMGDPTVQAANDNISKTSAGKYALEESAVGGSIGYSIRPLHLDLYGHFTYNLIFNRADILRAGINFNPSRSLHVQLEAYEVQPLFAADSIFNIFNIFPYDRGRGEVSWEIVRGLWLEAGLFILKVNGGPTGPSVYGANTMTSGLTFQGSDLAYGPSGGISYKREFYSAGIYAEASTNTSGDYAFGGNYRRGEAFGHVSFLENRLTGSLRVGFTTIQNDWVKQVNTGGVADPLTSEYIDLGARAVITDNVRANLNFIKNFNSVIEGNYRVLTVLEVHY